MLWNSCEVVILHCRTGLASCNPFILTSKFTVTKMERPWKEKHVIAVCGIPLVEKYVYEYDFNTQTNHLLRARQDAKKHQEQPSEENQPDPQDKSEHDWLPNGLPKTIWPAIIIALSIVVLILAYFTFQYIAIKNCPQKLQLDISKDSAQQYAAKLNEMEGAWNTTKQLNDKLNKEIDQITASKNDFEKYVRF